MKINKVVLTAIIILVVIFLLFEIFPIYWIISNSFKSFKDIVFYPPKFVISPELTNYKTAVLSDRFLSSLIDSAVITVISVFLAMLIGSMAAYGIARLKVGGTGLLMFLISSRMLPVIVLVLPIYIIFSKIRIIDTHIGLIIIYTTFLLSFVIWQMAGFFKELPREIEEAAIIDGCNYWQVFFRIIIPISKSGLTAVAIFCFLGAWNDYLFASILAGNNIKTAPVAISHFIAERTIPWGSMAAASTLTVIPVFILILIIQKQMVQGLTMGAIKG